jgi:hypothetical protein
MSLDPAAAAAAAGTSPRGVDLLDNGPPHKAMPAARADRGRFRYPQGSTGTASRPGPRRAPGGE